MSTLGKKTLSLQVKTGLPESTHSITTLSISCSYAECLIYYCTMIFIVLSVVMQNVIMLIVSASVLTAAVDNTVSLKYTNQIIFNLSSLHHRRLIALLDALWAYF
jgi:hypothetical protein